MLVLYKNSISLRLFCCFSYDAKFVRITSIIDISSHGKDFFLEVYPLNVLTNFISWFGMYVECCLFYFFQIIVTLALKERIVTVVTATVNSEKHLDVQ